MSKFKGYISDVQQKIVELHKLQSSSKKNPISTIRAIINNFQSTENVTILLGREHVSILS